MQRVVGLTPPWAAQSAPVAFVVNVLLQLKRSPGSFCMVWISVNGWARAAVRPVWVNWVNSEDSFSREQSHLVFDFLHSYKFILWLQQRNPQIIGSGPIVSFHLFSYESSKITNLSWPINFIPHCSAKNAISVQCGWEHSSEPDWNNNSVQSC